MSDLTGQTFSQLTALYRVAHPKHRPNHSGSYGYWRCRCSCGNEKDIRGDALLCGQTKSCGCLKVRVRPGDKFYRMTAIELAPKEQWRKTSRYWICRCDCGTVKTVSQYNLTTGGIKSCGCLPKEKATAKTKEFGDMPGAYWSRMIRGARVRKIEFNLTPAFVWKLFEKQGAKCALTGLPIGFSGKRPQDRYGQTASLDRIDSDGGYTEDNVQWIHKKLSPMKWKYSMEEFVDLCRRVAKTADDNEKMAV